MMNLNFLLALRSDFPEIKGEHICYIFVDNKNSQLTNILLISASMFKLPSSLRPTMSEVGGHFGYNAVMQKFRSGGRPNPIPWACNFACSLLHTTNPGLDA